MRINDRFKDNLLASTKLNVALVPGLNNKTLNGPISVPIGLDQVAENVLVTGMASAQTNTSHARPSMLASLSSFAENIQKALGAVAVGKPQTEYTGLSEVVKQDFVEWQGMIAAVALCNIYAGTGLKITVNTLQLTAENPAHKCILLEMAKDRYYQAAVTKNVNDGTVESGFLYYICQSGRPFAVFHPVIGLCAMKQYDASIFDGVIDWHQSIPGDCHGGWKHIVNNWTSAGAKADRTAFLDEFCLSRIAWWAQHNGLRNYSLFLNPSYLPDEALAVNNSIPNAININNVPGWKGKGDSFGTAMMFYLDDQNDPQPMPDLFTDTMLVTYTGGRASNKLVYNAGDKEESICFPAALSALDEFAPVAPLRKTIMPLLKCATLDKISFDALMVGKNLQSVTVELKISTKGTTRESFSIHRTYGHEKLRLGQLPSLMIWPFIALPDGLDLWKNFYATWHPQVQLMRDLKYGDGAGERIRKASNLNYDFGSQGTTRYVYRPTAQNDCWPVCTGDKPFRYAQVLEGNVEMGMVFVPAVPTYSSKFVPGAAANPNILDTPVKVAVDFGTTSTVCAMSHHAINGGAVTPLPFKDYGKVITCDDEKARENMDTQHWLGNTGNGSGWSWDKKFFSVAQLFQRLDGTGPSRSNIGATPAQDYYVDGRMFLVSGTVMTNYATANKSATNDPLLDQQIMNDMKFNQNLDVKNYQAASIYLAGIYLYTVLYLLSQKMIPGAGPYIELSVSYPNDVTLNALRNSWNWAKNILDKVLDLKLTASIQTMNFYNEATATTSYYRSGTSTLALLPSLVSLDIGGGTTDISITNTLNPDKVRNLSMRYAGREIMVSSIIEYYRRFSSDSMDNRDTSFHGLWAGDPQGVVSLCKQFMELCKEEPGQPVMPAFLHGLTANSTVRMNVEMLLSEGMNMASIFQPGAHNLLRQLITLKFLMVLQIAARTVHDNIDLWKNPNTGKLELNYEGGLEINLSVSGTSAQLLQYVFDCNMATLATLQNPRMSSQQTQRCMNVINHIFADELRDVLEEGKKPDVKIFIDQYVKEKREVCYGMLQPSIAAYAQAANAGLPALTVGTNNQQARATAQAKMEMDLLQYSQKVFAEYLYGEVDENGGRKRYENGKPREGVKWGIMDYLEEYERGYFGQSQTNFGLSSEVPAISCLLDAKNYHQYFNMSRMAVSQSRAQYMIEPEQAKYKDMLACMYLVDEIIDWEMANFQLM